MSKHFKIEEFECKCGCGYNDINTMIPLMLDTVRDAYGKAITVTSGCRCKVHNKSVGGFYTSSHLTGYAVDIKCDNVKDRIELVMLLIQVGFNRIGIANTFIHVDIDPNKNPALWIYNK